MNVWTLVRKSSSTSLLVTYIISLLQVSYIHTYLMWTTQGLTTCESCSKLSNSTPKKLTWVVFPPNEKFGRANVDANEINLDQGSVWE